MGVQQPTVPGWFARPVRWAAERRNSVVAQARARRIEPYITGAVVLAAVALTVAFQAWPNLSFMLYMPLVLVGGVFLRGRWMARGFLGIAACFVVAAFVLSPIDMRSVTAGASLVATMLVVLLVERAWRQAGLPQQIANSMLRDLRERQAVQSNMPTLPSGWSVDTSVLPAHGESFCGDIVIGNATDGRFNAAVLDVSGKGSAAGSRAVLLGGAVAGLLGAIDADEVLAKLNDYLIRQGWTDGFATAVHLDIDLHSGAFGVASAGHPSAIRLKSDGVSWDRVAGAPGVVLGILENQEASDYPRSGGTLEPGEALVLFTDGMVEDAGTGVDEGMSRLARIAHRELMMGTEDVAARISATAQSGEDDDRTVLVLHRH